MATRRARRRSSAHHSSGSPGGWLSGASGEGVDDGTGAFGTWRGLPVALCTTWSDADSDNAAHMYQLMSGGGYEMWTGSCDLATGGMWPAEGDSWAAAAAGSYDARWAATLNQAKTLWTNKSRGTLYIRPFHEWSGFWFPWTVTAGDRTNFIAAWRRYYTQKQAVFPAAQLEWCTNGNQNSGSGATYDWRTAWPGDAYVDVYGTDWYSGQWNDTGGNSGGLAVDSYGGPVGLEAHRQFALAHGKPIVIPEWGVQNSATGDVPNYVQYMYDFAVANGSSTPTAGKLLYEALFNVVFTPNDFGLYPESGTLSPLSATKYKTLFT